MIGKTALAGTALCLAACGAYAADGQPVLEAPDPASPGISPERREAIEVVRTLSPTPPRVLDQRTKQRLLHNKGITLQWIDWDHRGIANIREEGGELRLTASQFEAGGPGQLFLDGLIEEVGETYFTFRGTIRIADTPDRGRMCERTKSWHFAITQDRPYYRLREFEWCDGLTDYIDIYF